MSKIKISKHPYHDDPTAFSKNFPRIEIVKDEKSGLSLLGETTMYKMGKVRAAVTVQKMGYFMSVYGRDCYPTWDEIVWLRYNLIPDAAVMALLLPNLDSYINNDGNNFKFVFTMEQTGWAFTAIPTCDKCHTEMEMRHTEYASGVAVCKTCGYEESVDFSTLNERHGSGLKAVKA